MPDTATIAPEADATLDAEPTPEPDCLTAADGQASGHPSTDSPPTVAEPPDNPEADQLTAILRRIEEQEDVCDELEQEADAAKVAAKHARERYDQAVDDLRRLVREGKRARSEPTTPGPLFEKLGSPADAPSSSADPDDDQSWRPVPLADLGLAPSILEALAAVAVNALPLTTLGQLVDYQSLPTVSIESIRGIGPASADKIADACAAFWDNRHKARRAEGKPVELHADAIDVEFEVQGSEGPSDPGIDAHHDPDAHLLLDEAQAMTAADPPAAGPDEPAPSAESDGDGTATVKMPTGPRGKRRRQGV